MRDERREIVLADAEHPALPVNLLAPPGRMALPKVRVFVDFATTRLRAAFVRVAAEAGALG